MHLDRRLWARRAGLLLRWFAIVAACYLGGVAATNLAPTVVDTDNYRAVLRLDPLPRHFPVLHSPTIVGDVDVSFASPFLAPGLDVAVSVREGITGVLTEPDLTVRALQPSDAEISSAISAAAVGVGLRFATGALVVGLGISLTRHFGISRRPPTAHLARIASAVTATVVGTASSIVMTYRPANFLAYETTGVLGTVQRNAGMLEGVEARAAQATPYVRNLLAVSQALQERFVPAELNQPVAARLLLVSDIHGVNPYPLMKAIIAEEGIDAVVDSGDFINFGRVEEADAAGMFAGIQSLGVPYIFVRGNHDASSSTDTALLSRLAQVPNVVLLQQPDGDYTELSFRGLRITGFNDPRWFGDDNKDPVAKEAPAVDAYNQAMADQPESDLVVTHEPYAAKDVARGDVRVNGHIHTADLQGNRIQVGTFTGGGVVAHFTEGEDAELTGQPYAFDIVTFGAQCRMTQLTRYTYRNLLEGRPAYDSVQVINGARVDPSPVVTAPARQPGAPAPADEADQRTCSRLEPTTSRVIPRRTGEGTSASTRAPAGTAVPAGTLPPVSP